MNKSVYEAPLAEVREIKSDGVICTSQQGTMDRQDYDYEEW